MDNVIQVDDFLAYTIGILVYFAGMKLNDTVGFFRRFHIPEPVSGGILAGLVALGIFLASGISFAFEMETRDRLLVYFFTAIGINARLGDLAAGGRPLFILLGLTLAYILLQNLVGVAAAASFGQAYAIGLLAGSVSLIGGHGTTIAWAPEIAAAYGLPGAMEIGIAAATLGLVIASLMGGPIATFLIKRHRIRPVPEREPDVGLQYDREDVEKINHISIMRVFLALHVAIIIGYGLHGIALGFGLKLPLFVPCMLAAIAMSNTLPRLFPKLRWPARTRALAVVSDFSLGLFIAMSLMGMQLWAIADLAGGLLLILAVQVVAAVLFILFLVFPLMGRDYRATVLSAGFAGFALGATPTAIANMTAVTKSHGPEPTAFIILPLVGAFFVDICNALVIRLFMGGL